VDKKGLQDKKTVIIDVRLIMLFVKGRQSLRGPATAKRWFASAQHVFDLIVAIRNLDNISDAGMSDSGRAAGLVEHPFFFCRARARAAAAALDYATHAGTLGSRFGMTIVRVSTELWHVNFGIEEVGSTKKLCAHRSTSDSTPLMSPR
jgi:hypothetical protein